MKQNPSVCIIGLGYIGLPTAALIASKQISVCGTDISSKVVDTINEGKIHIVEPDLDGLVKSVVDKGFLRASLEPCAADVFMVAVPTPLIEECGDSKDSFGYLPEMKYVMSAADSILPYLREGNLVILESTSPVGSTEKIAERVFGKRPELKGKINFAYCPERVLPGRIIYELEHNDRVIGGIDKGSTEKASVFYSLFVKGDLHKTNARIAEMCKLVENAYRDVNIAFANELSMICDEAGINTYELIRLSNKHPRVNILQPGPGVGGHCIAVDPWFIVHDFAENARLIKTSREVNLKKTDWVIQQIENNIEKFRQENGREPRIVCMGLAYKPDVDDLRESPALRIAQNLYSRGYKVAADEPNLAEYEDLPLADICEDTAFDIYICLVMHSKYKAFKAPESAKVYDYCGLFA